MSRCLRPFALVLACLAFSPALWPAQGEGQIRFQMGHGSLAQVMRFVAAARSSLDIEMYHLTDRSVMRALVAAAGRGVRVRLILDPSQRRNLKVPDRLAHSRIEVRWMDTDEGRGELMHAKASLADGEQLLVGSANWTHTGLSVSHETGVVIEDRIMAADFSRAFEEDWAHSKLAWPSHGLHDEELMSLPDPSTFYDDRPRTHPRRRAGEE